jgi:hypothetical protein
VGTSSSPTTIVFGPSNDGPINVRSISLEAAGFPSIMGVDLLSASDVSIERLRTNGYRGAAGVLRMQSSVRCNVGVQSMIGFGSSGAGIQLRNSTKCRIDGGSVSTFAIGITGMGTGGNTLCSARGLSMTGNTANTDLAAGQVSVDATCENVTL